MANDHRPQSAFVGGFAALTAGALLLVAPAGVCRASDEPMPDDPGRLLSELEPDEDRLAAQRSLMVDEQLASALHGQPIADQRVLEAMRKVPRHAFVPPGLIYMAYSDQSLSIGRKQEVPAPYLIALTAELAQVKPGDRVLEVGTGCGYQTAVLTLLTDRVYSIESDEKLARRAEWILTSHGYQPQLRIGDGSLGWPEAVDPFDVILINAAAPAAPEALLAELAEGGRLVIPLGKPIAFNLTVFTRREGAVVEAKSIPLRLEPMTGTLVQAEVPAAAPAPVDTQVGAGP